MPPRNDLPLPCQLHLYLRSLQHHLHALTHHKLDKNQLGYQVSHHLQHKIAIKCTEGHLFIGIVQPAADTHSRYFFPNKEGNYLGDDGFSPLLKGQLNNLVYLDLSNTEITSSTVEGLVGVKMTELRILALNKNKLDKRAMESIGKLQAKKLYALSL